MDFHEWVKVFLSLLLEMRSFFGVLFGYQVTFLVKNKKDLFVTNRPTAETMSFHH